MRAGWAVAPLMAGALVLPRAAAATDAVVGSGPGTCTEAALDSALAIVRVNGGTVTFNCGGPATITLTSQKVFRNGNKPDLVYEIDGGGLVTLSGGAATRLILHGTGTLNLRNIVFTAGYAQGGEDNASGGAIRSDGALAGAWPVHLNLTNVTFVGNATNLTVAPTPPFSPFDYGGGALFTRFGIVTISGCTFTANTAYNTAGGALHIRSSTVNVTRSTFSGNVSNGGGFGGAIHADGLSPTPTAVNGSLQISSTRFTGNRTRNMGGAVFTNLYAEKAESVTLNTVSVIGNKVQDASGTFLGTRSFGGGLALGGGNVSISNSTVADNLVSSPGGGAGGGIALLSNGAVSIANSTISGNRAEGTTSSASGGGVLISGNTQPFQITHSTIAFNSAGWSGGGLQTDAGGTLLNTIVAGNDATAYPITSQCSAPLTNGGGVLEFPASGSSPCVSGSRITTDPSLGPLAQNGGFSETRLLGDGSPAIDAGACVVGTDQRGVARPQGAACDLGAVEVGEPPPVGTDFHTIAPCRALDTRQAGGPTGGAPLICGVGQVVTLTGGACGVPASAKAVAANVVVTQTAKAGYVNVYPRFTFPPATAVVNYAAGATRANNAILFLGSGGQVVVRCAPTGTAHVVVDVSGYFE